MCKTTLSFVNIDEVGLDVFVSYMVALSLFSGLFMILLSVFQLGKVTWLLSETLVTAFTAASAFNIGGSQLKHYFGVSMSANTFVEVIRQLFSLEMMKKYNWYSVVFGVVATILLYSMKKANKKWLSSVTLPVEVRELFMFFVYVYVYVYYCCF